MVLFSLIIGIALGLAALVAYDPFNTDALGVWRRKGSTGSDHSVQVGEPPSLLHKIEQPSFHNVDSTDNRFVDLSMAGSNLDFALSSSPFAFSLAVPPVLTCSVQEAPKSNVTGNWNEFCTPRHTKDLFLKKPAYSRGPVLDLAHFVLLEERYRLIALTTLDALLNDTMKSIVFAFVFVSYVLLVLDKCGLLSISWKNKHTGDKKLTMADIHVAIESLQACGSSPNISEHDIDTGTIETIMTPLPQLPFTPKGVPVGRLAPERLRPFCEPAHYSWRTTAHLHYPSPASLKPQARIPVSQRIAYNATKTPAGKPSWRDRFATDSSSPSWGGNTAPDPGFYSSNYTQESDAFFDGHVSASPSPETGISDAVPSAWRNGATVGGGQGEDLD